MEEFSGYLDVVKKLYLIVSNIIAKLLIDKTDQNIRCISTI